MPQRVAPCGGHGCGVGGGLKRDWCDYANRGHPMLRGLLDQVCDELRAPCVRLVECLGHESRAERRGAAHRLVRYK
jgi:hypothetical protein